MQCARDGRTGRRDRVPSIDRSAPASYLLKRAEVLLRPTVIPVPENVVSILADSHQQVLVDVLGTALPQVASAAGVVDVQPA